MIEVINRELLIPREEYNIGTCYDDNTETRHFHLKRVTSGGVDLAALTFNLDIQYADGNTDAASLVKEVTDKDINLVLTINNSMLQVPGTVLIQIRALDEDGVCKWTSYKSAFFVEDHINTPGHYEGDLTQLEQYEAEWGKVRDNVNQLNLRMDEVVRIRDESPATEVEEEVVDARVGADNVVYGSLGSAIRKQFENVYEAMEDDTGDSTAAVAAEATARQNADTAETTARQDADTAEAAARQSADNTLQTNINFEASTRATADAGLQTQINQIIAPSGEAPSAAEVQNARIGADGVTYSTLGESIRKNDNKLRNLINDSIITTALGEEGEYNVSSSDIIQGSYTLAGGNIVYGNMISIQRNFAVYKGLKVSFAPGTVINQWYVYKYDVDGNFLGNMGWKNTGFVVNWDGYMNICLRNSNAINITPSDYDAEIKFLSVIANNIKALSYKLNPDDNIDNFNLETGDINGSDGSEQASDYIYRSAFFKIKGKLEVCIPENHQFRIFEYNSSDVYQGVRILQTETKTFLYGKEGYKYRFLYSKNPVALPDNGSLFYAMDKSLDENEVKVYFELGGIDASGNEESLTNFYRSQYIQVNKGNIIKITDENADYEYRIHTYDTSYVHEHRELDVKNNHCFICEDGYVRFTVHKRNNGNIQNIYANMPIVYIYNDCGELLENESLYFESWAQGSISGSTGQNEPQANVIRSAYIDYVFDEPILIKNTSGYRTRVYYYKDRTTYVGCDDWDNDTVKVIRPKTNTIRLLLAKNPYSEITPSDATNISVQIASLKTNLENSVYKKTDTLVSSMIRSNLMNGITLSDVKTIETIVGETAIANDGTLYVGVECNDTIAYESADHAYAALFVFNIIDPNNVERYTVIKEGDLLPYINPAFGVQETITKAWDTLAVFKDSTTVRVFTKIFTNTTAQYLVYRDFNVATKQFGEIGVLSTVIDNTTYVMWGNNNATIRELLDLQDINPEEDSYSLLMNCSIVSETVNDTKWYYTDISYGCLSHVLVKSSDLTNWSPVDEIQIPTVADEIMIAKNGDTFYLVNRADYTKKDDLYVREFFPLTETWGRLLNLRKPSFGSERPCILIIDNNLYIQQCIGNVTVDGATMPRAYDTYIKVDLKMFEEVKRINVKFDTSVVYPRFITVGRAVYMLAGTDKRGYFTRGSDGRQELTISYFDYHLMDIV